MDIFKALTRAFDVGNGLPVHDNGMPEHRRGSNEHRAIQKAGRNATRPKSRHESHRLSPVRANGQNAAANDFTVENALGPHVTEEEPRSFAGRKGVSDGGISGKRSSSHMKVPGEHAAGKDRAIENNVSTRMVQGECLSATGVKDSCHGDAQDQRPVGWSVRKNEPEGVEISISEEEEMLHLSQSSVSEQQNVKRTTPQVDVTSQKRRKRQKNGLLKRPRAGTAKNSSRFDGDILHPNRDHPKKLQIVEREDKESKQFRTKASSETLCDVGNEYVPSPEPSKNVKTLRNYETALAKKGFLADHDRLLCDAPEGPLSAELQKNIVITVHCMDVPERKRNSTEKKQHRDVEEDLSAVADSEDARAFSPGKALGKRKLRLKTKKGANDAGGDAFREEELQSSRDPCDANALEVDQQDVEQDNPAKCVDDVPYFSRLGTTKGNGMGDIEDSRRRRVKKSKSRCRYELSPNDRAGQKLISPIGEDGHNFSKDTLQIGMLLRERLLHGAIDNGDDIITSEEVAGGEDPSIADQRPSDASVQIKGMLDDCNERQYQPIAENSQSGRSSLDFDDESPPPEMHQRMEKKSHTSVATGEKVFEAPGSLAKQERRTKRKRRRSGKSSKLKVVDLCGTKDVNSARKREQGEAKSKQEELARHFSAKRTSIPKSTGTEGAERQWKEKKNSSTSEKGTQPSNLKGAEYAEAHENVRPVRGQRLVPKRPRTTSAKGKDVDGGETKSPRDVHHESSLAGRADAQKATVNLRNVNNDQKCVQIEIEEPCLNLPGCRQRSMKEVTAHRLSCTRPTGLDGEKSLKEPPSKGSDFPPPESPDLDSRQGAQRIDVERTGRERAARSTQPKETPRPDEELSIPGSTPGDMSRRNRRRTGHRKQREIPETLPPLVHQRRPYKEEKEIPQKKKNLKSRATPSSIVGVTDRCHAMARSAIVPANRSQIAPERPRSSQIDNGQRREVYYSEQMLDTERLFDSAESAEEELLDENNLNYVAEETENTAWEENIRKKNQNPRLPPLKKQSESGSALDRSISGVDAAQRLTKETKLAQRTETLDSRHAQVSKTSSERNLDDLVDPNELQKQSELLIRKSRRARSSRVGGARRDRTLKALDELSDDEGSKDKAWTPTASSSTQPQSSATQMLKGQAQKTHHMRTRARTSTHTPLEQPAIIDLTDIGDEDMPVIDVRATEDDDDIAESLKELQQLSLEDKTKHICERPRSKYLTPLSDDESKLATDLITRTKRDTKIVTIAEAGITLRGESFKRLRGTRWLDDEVLNAYVSLINSRNDAIFDEMDEEHRAGIPRAYVFNTYFFTRLCSGSSGFDYPGVKGWTKRAKVDILQRDIILIPINLGNHHWVLSGVDIEHREVLYMDSMHGPDRVDALSKLKRWVFEELRHKHGEEVALEHNPESWREVENFYRVRRVGILPEKIEPRTSHAGRVSRVPRQKDGGSCGVFIAKMADCLSLGIKVYFKQKDIYLIRRRMALDLFNGYIPL